MGADDIKRMAANRVGNVENSTDLLLNHATETQKAIQEAAAAPAGAAKTVTDDASEV